MQTTIEKMLTNVQNAATKSITKNRAFQNRIQIFIVTKAKIEYMVSKKAQTLNTYTTASLFGVGTGSAIIEKEVYYLLNVICFVSA